MFALSSNIQDQVVPLPESSEVLEIFLGILTGNMDPDLDLPKSLILYELFNKYDVAATHRKWIISTIQPLVKEDPFEVLAVACENEPVAISLVQQAIQEFPPFWHPTTSTYSKVDHIDEMSLAALKRLDGITYAHADPAYFSPNYIQRLGIRCFACYVAAWNLRNPTRLSPTGGSIANAKEELKNVAERFVEMYLRWNA